MAEQNVTLQPGESKVISFEAVPQEAKTYQVSVNGISGSFRAIVPVPVDMTFTVRIINAEILDQTALEVFGLPVYGCGICVVNIGYMESEGGEILPYPIFWETTNYATYVAHMRSEHPTVAIEEESTPSRGQWMPQVPNRSHDRFIREDWLTIDQEGELTIPYTGGEYGGEYWNPEFPWVYLSITGGPYLVGGQPTYGPLNQPYGTPVELHQGALVTFNYATKAFTVS